MPSITDVSASTGYTSGGQEIEIKGTSLDGTTIAIEVDGRPCEVISSSASKITCKTTETVLGTSQSNYSGQHGLRHKFVSNDSADVSNYDSYSADWEKLMTNFEIAYTQEWNKNVNVISGYFEAPVDGQYQFHMSCDDECKFFMSTSDPMNPAAKEQRIHRRGS